MGPVSAAARAAAARPDRGGLGFGLFGVFLLYLTIHTVRYRRKLRERERDRAVRTASAEAAEDDSYFASDELERHALALFRAAQMAWDACDRKGVARLVEPDLLVEWERRLDDFDRKGGHNRVKVLEDPTVLYVGITSRDDDDQDRAVVRMEAKLGPSHRPRRQKVMRAGEKDELVTPTEYWTLARRDRAWMVHSIEQRAEGDHHLDSQVVASPWSDEQRLDDESLTELAVADGLPVDVELGGRRYVEDRDTAAVMSGSKDGVATFTARWTLALDGPPDAPWRIVGIA